MAASINSRCVIWIARGFLAITGSFVSTLQTLAFDCRASSPLLDERIPLATSLQDAASKKIEAAQAEAACRGAFRADPVNPNVMFRLARALALGNRPMEGIKYYLDAADRGHASAMNDLAEVFEYGIGVPKNLVTALEWYERAAGVGHTGAMAHLGQLHENGSEIPQDLAKAKYWYEKAATLGHAASMNSLANLLKQAGNLPGAVDWYGKAAERGVAGAMNR